MPRRTVWVSDEIDHLAAQLPDVNWSAALADGIRALAGCTHPELRCSCCGHPTTAAAIAAGPLEAFYRSTMFELGRRVAQPGYEGAARIVARVAVDHQVPGVAAVAVPRATRAQHQARLDVAELPREADSRRRHPTALPVPTNHPGPQPAPTQENIA